MSEKTERRYCPYCGSKVAEYGHDDDCGAPSSVVRVTRAQVLAAVAIVRRGKRTGHPVRPGVDRIAALEHR